MNLAAVGSDKISLIDRPDLQWRFGVLRTNGEGPTESVSRSKDLETLLQFAAPLLDTLRSEAPERQIREALEVAYTAWNAVIFADVLNNNRYIDEARRLTANAGGPAMLIEQMIARERELFADDTRLIGNWRVTRTEDGINLHADARDPQSLPRNPADQH